MFPLGFVFVFVSHALSFSFSFWFLVLVGLVLLFISIFILRFIFVFCFRLLFASYSSFRFSFFLLSLSFSILLLAFVSFVRFQIYSRFRLACPHFQFVFSFSSFHFYDPFRPFIFMILFVLLLVFVPVFLLPLLFSSCIFPLSTSFGTKVVEHTREGVSQLQRAEEHQKSALPIKCIAILVFLIILMLALLVWKHSD